MGAGADHAERPVAISRTSSGVPTVPVIDGFRAYAILGVVVVHFLALSGVLGRATGTPLGLVIWGLLGNVIDAFFIISGFVMLLPIVARGGRFGSVSDYAIGRAARLVPPYWLCIAVLLALLALIPPPGVGLPSAGNVLVHLTALQMPARLVDSNFSVGFGVDGPLWMISVIVGFYAVLPLIARAYCRRPLVGLAVAALITVLWKEGAAHLTGAFESLEGGGVPGWIVQLIAVDQLPGWAFSFALGMTAAWAWVQFGDRPLTAGGRRLLIGAGVAAAFGIGLCAYEYGLIASEINAPYAGTMARTDTWLGLAYSASRAVLMAVIALGPLWLQRPFANRPVRWLSELSYGFYLIHFPCGVFIGLVILDLPVDGTAGAFALWSAVIGSLSLGYAYLSLHLVERPARRWLRRRAGHAPGRRSPHPGTRREPDQRRPFPSA